MMKKIATLIIAVMVVQMTAVMANAATKTYNKKPATKAKTTKQTKETLTIPYNGSDYLLKYNIDDLESAPWLNGGKRKI